MSSRLKEKGLHVSQHINVVGVGHRHETAVASRIDDEVGRGKQSSAVGIDFSIDCLVEHWRVLRHRREIYRQRQRVEDGIRRKVLTVNRRRVDDETRAQVEGVALADLDSHAFHL